MTGKRKSRGVADVIINLSRNAHAALLRGERPTVAGWLAMSWRDPTDGPFWREYVGLVLVALAAAFAVRALLP